MYGTVLGAWRVILMLPPAENEPLIPADTPFVFKTNDTLEKVAGDFATAGGSGLNLLAHQSYFERPEVLKAYREQTIIETPEFTNVSDTPSVGGRLRVRTTEEVCIQSCYSSAIDKIPEQLG